MSQGGPLPGPENNLLYQTTYHVYAVSSIRRTLSLRIYRPVFPAHEPPNIA
jgi:hypothetical protein